MKRFVVILFFITSVSLRADTIVLGVTKKALESSRGQFSHKLYECVFQKLGHDLEVKTFPAIRLAERTKSGNIFGELIRMSGYGKAHPYLTRVRESHFQRINSDCTIGNIIWKDDEPIILDFDDFQVGPIAMDVKLLSFGWKLDTLSDELDPQERRKIQHELILKYYREVNEFKDEWEKLFPLMSAYRDIQFDAWFSSHWREPGFAKAYAEDDITQPHWWDEAIKGVEELLK